MCAGDRLVIKCYIYASEELVAYIYAIGHVRFSVDYMKSILKKMKVIQICKTVIKLTSLGLCY